MLTLCWREQCPHRTCDVNDIHLLNVIVELTLQLSSVCVRGTKVLLFTWPFSLRKLRVKNSKALIEDEILALAYSDSEVEPFQNSDSEWNGAEELVEDFSEDVSETRQYSE